MRRITGDSNLTELSRDAGTFAIHPVEAAVADTDGDVLELLAEANAKGLSVTPRGAGTSIPSQAIGRGIILLQNRNEILQEVDSVTCGPSIVKERLNAELDRNGVWVPVDPSSYRACTVGGMVANNSSGTRTLKYGSTIDHVQDLTVVLPESGLRKVMGTPSEESLDSSEARKVASLITNNWKSIQEEIPRVSKNSSGYRLERVIHDGLFDFPKLFVGSEGTLGITTSITFQTLTKPKSRALMIVDSTLSELDKVVSLFRSLKPSAIELVDKSVFRETGNEDRLRAISRSDDQYLVFCEIDGDEPEDVEEGLERAAVSDIAGYEPLALNDAGEITTAWGVRNDILTLATELKREGKILVPGVEDLVVPPEHLGDLIKLLTEQFETQGLDYISYGHAGDANLHMRPFLDPNSRADMAVLYEVMEECFEWVWKVHGSMTGEHGDGMLRARFVSRQYPKTYEIMKEIRKIFDPKSILNPGVKII